MRSSIRGHIVKELIAHVTSTHLLGEKIRSGELRKNLVEPKWKCPSDYEMRELCLPNCRAELLHRKKDARSDFVVLQLHGGGYVGAMRNAYRSFGVLYSEAGAGMDVLTVDYRVAPEHPYPAALLDAADAYGWLTDNGWQPSRIFLAGDSAGGGLAMGLCMLLRDRGIRLPAGIIAMSPWTDLTASGPSYQENYEKDPLFGNTRDSLIYNRDYVADNDPRNPYISPLFGAFEGFPPMLIQVGSIEMLLSDSVLAAQKAQEAGVSVQLHIYEEMFHIFQMAMKLMPESQQAWKEIAVFLQELAGEEGNGR